MQSLGKNLTWAPGDQEWTLASFMDGSSTRDHLQPSSPGHDSVLVAEMLEVLFRADAPPGGTYCDATIGLGGHARAILDRSAPGGRLIGLDRDPEALAIARARLASFGDRVTLVHAPFSRLRSVLDDLGAGPVDGLVADLGVSSPQLDKPERGFSFQRNGPLDMRMDQTAGPTAAELLAQIGQADLERVIRDYGEERFAGRIARHITEARGRSKLDSTAILAAIVAAAIPRGRQHKNPATRTFQALRIAVNRELDELKAFLDEAPACLRPGGRLCVIAFHSLEDRMVKRRFRTLSDPATTGPKLRMLNKRIIVASEEEQRRNPRARSAKMRAVERVS
jgi:16S rRNA (cytosine1402-N4)-methyltransferase